MGSLTGSIVDNPMPTPIHMQVRELMVALDQQILPFPQVPCDPAIIRLRASLVSEECFELLEAIFGEIPAIDLARSQINNMLDPTFGADPCVDMIKLTDALADIDVVVEGTRLAFGIDGESIAVEVHRSNMAKRGGPKRADGKGLKPEGWTPPNIAECLRLQGWLGEQRPYQNKWETGWSPGSTHGLIR